MTLAEISLKIGSGATPTGGQASYLAERRRWAFVRSQNVFDRHFSDEGLAYISDEQAERLAGVGLQEGDILLNITGDGVTFGRACEVPKAALPAVVNQHVSIIRVNPQLADEGFLLSYLTHPNVKHYIESFNAGGSRRAITKAHIGSFEVPLPPLPVQHAISRILGALDDRIELNRQMNRTLEALAATIFQSWFLDFDPVVAKAEGRAPFGMSAETAALFPSSFEDSDLGPIPECWDVQPAGSVVEMRRVTVNPSARPEEEFEHFSIPAYDAGQLPALQQGKEIKSSKFLVQPGSVLLSKLNPSIPRIWLTAASGGVRRSICSTEFLVAVPSSGTCASYVYSLFRSTAFHSDFAALVTGTTGSRQRVQPGDLLKLKIVRPPIAPMAKFGNIATPLFDRVQANLKESESVQALRDTLLPKLLSGEIRVKQAEKALAGV